MSQYIDKDVLVAEIEKRIESCAKQREDMLNVQCCALADDASARMGELNCIQDFIDTLEVKEVQEETVSEELEKAALLYYPKMSRISEPHGIIPADNESHYICDANEDNRIAFKAGAKWQKEQDQSTIELVEDHAILTGMNKMEQQMMAKAIDSYCFGFQGDALFSFKLPAGNYLVGSKVKVIVINED